MLTNNYIHHYFLYKFKYLWMNYLFKSLDNIKKEAENFIRLNLKYFEVVDPFNLMEMDPFDLKEMDPFNFMGVDPFDFVEVGPFNLMKVDPSN